MRSTGIVLVLPTDMLSWRWNNVNHPNTVQKGAIFTVVIALFSSVVFTSTYDSVSNDFVEKTLPADTHTHLYLGLFSVAKDHKRRNSHKSHKDCQNHRIVSLLVMLDMRGMTMYLSILARDEDPSLCVTDTDQVYFGSH